MDESQTADITVNFGTIGIPSNAKSVAVYDLWNDSKNIANVAATSYAYTGKSIEGHSCAIYRLALNSQNYYCINSSYCLDYKNNL